MDRLLIDFSLDGSGPLTRSIGDASTSGFIANDAPHWSIEPFIPLLPETLTQYLVGRGELAADQEQLFRECSERIGNILHQRTSSYQAQFAALYARLDPDSDDRDPLASRRRESATDDRAARFDPTLEVDSVAPVIALCQQVLQQAGYRRLSQEDVECCVGVASQWGVPLHVDLDLFRLLVVYARGDVMGTRLRRRLRKMYRRESVEVPIYQRMVVMFHLHEDHDSEEGLTASALHLRMFKNIPKQDIDMLLPGSRIRISGVDHAKIILPSLGGFLMSLRKIAQYALLFAAIAFSWTLILIGLLVGYMVKSVLSYFQTKNKYQLNLTKNLYFQKLDANAGVGYRIIQQSHRQSALEMILAYYAALTSDVPLSTRKLRRRCERIIREAIDIEVDFQVDRAVEQLAEMGALTQTDGHWQAQE